MPLVARDNDRKLPSRALQIPFRQCGPYPESRPILGSEPAAVIFALPWLRSGERVGSEATARLDRLQRIDPRGPKMRIAEGKSRRRREGVITLRRTLGELYFRCNSRYLLGGIPNRCLKAYVRYSAWRKPARSAMVTRDSFVSVNSSITR